jgi:hypothetical protein
LLAGCCRDAPRELPSCEGAPNVAVFDATGWHVTTRESGGSQLQIWDY